MGFRPEILGSQLDLSVPINQQDLCPSPREALCDGASDPARRSGVPFMPMRSMLGSDVGKRPPSSTPLFDLMVDSGVVGRGPHVVFR